MRPPIFGYHLPSFTHRDAAPDEIFLRTLDLARGAERAGFDLVTVMDHFHQIPVVGRPEEPMLEAYTTLGALAASTERTRLATLVTGVTYRNPALVAKMVTTLDVISRGRAILGLGAAWHEEEHHAYGFDFPRVGERMDRLDEALTIARLMFTEDRPVFQGRHYRIDGALNFPRPIQAGGPPILVGGGGEKRTLRLVAKHADISHWFGTLEDLKRKTEILERYCEEEGRDPASILRTAGAPVVLVEDESQVQAASERIPPERRALMTPATPERAAEILRSYISAGFGGFTFGNTGLRTPAALQLAGELIKLLRPSAVQEAVDRVWDVKAGGRTAGPG